MRATSSRRPSTTPPPCVRARRCGSPGSTSAEVTGVEAEGDAVKVTFTVDDEGRPIHTDAEVELRPRLFLEGNWFLDLFPGSPSAPELEAGEDIPITQTQTAVQLDEVLTALQAPERRGLQRLLEGYGTALTYEPTAEDDVDQDPSVRGETAAESLNDAFRYGGDAGRGTAIVNTALLGENRGRPGRLHPRLRRDLRQARRPRGRALRPDHQLQRLHRRPGGRVGEPLAARSRSWRRRSRRPSRRCWRSTRRCPPCAPWRSSPSRRSRSCPRRSPPPTRGSTRRAAWSPTTSSAASPACSVTRRRASRRRPTRRRTSSSSRRCSPAAPRASWCRPATWWSRTASAPGSRTTTSSSTRSST